MLPKIEQFDLLIRLLKGQAIIIYTLKFIDSNVSNYVEIWIETLFSKIMGRIGFFPYDKIIEAVSWGLIDSLLQIAQF